MFPKRLWRQRGERSKQELLDHSSMAAYELDMMQRISIGMHMPWTLQVTRQRKFLRHKLRGLASLGRIFDAGYLGL